jgi:hypothetical protein
MGSPKTSLDSHPTEPCHSLSALEVREILVKVPKKDRKCVAFGKEKTKIHFVLSSCGWRWHA